MKIWSAWLQGRSNAPDFVKKIFDLWEELNPNAQFKVIENEEASDILKEMGVNTEFMTFQVKANIVRSYVLAKYGGTWVDSTLLPTMPLNSWLTPDLCRAGFFAFRSTGHPDLVIQNWFLYAEKGNLLVEKWLNHYCDYFKVPRYIFNSKKILLTSDAFDYFKSRLYQKNHDFMYFVDPSRGRSCKSYPYAFHNYTLSYLLKNDEEIRSIWSNVPTLFNSKPSILGHYASDPETHDGAMVDILLDLLDCSPVHKLNHKFAGFSSLIDQARLANLILRESS